MPKHHPGQMLLGDFFALDDLPPPDFQEAPEPQEQQRPEAAAAPEVSEDQDQADDQLEAEGPDAAALDSLLRRRAKRLRKAGDDLDATIKQARAAGLGWGRIAKNTGQPKASLIRKYRNA